MSGWGWALLFGYFALIIACAVGVPLALNAREERKQGLR